MSSTPQDQYLAVCKELERLRHDIARHVEIAATQAQELEELRAELAAARALLQSVRGTLDATIQMYEPHEYVGQMAAVRDKIDATLAGEKSNGLS